MRTPLRSTGTGASAGVVVVGAGPAGVGTAVALRERGYPWRIVLAGEERTAPYERSALSKGYLTGEVDEDMLRLHSSEYYARRSIHVLTEPVTAIDRAARTVRLAGGAVLGYDHLVLATGARARTLPVPGSGLRGVHTLRTLADARALRAGLRRAAAVVVVGAGRTGLEVAAAARGLGCAVTVVEALDRPLAQVVGARTAEHFTRLHRGRGNELLFGRTVSGFLDGGTGTVAAVELSDGRLLPADLVLVGAGSEPRTELAGAAGLDVEGGVVVDDRLGTRDPAVSAVGDCAALPHPAAGRRVRPASAYDAAGHARVVAERLTGADRPHADPPRRGSDQFTSTLRVAGLAGDGDTEVVLGPWPDAFSVLRFRGDRLVAVESVNRAGDHAAALALLAEGTPLDPGTASGRGFSLEEYAGRRRGFDDRP
ncbi:FAD-dependent oxidoreductase [Streptomyces capparidis]